MADLKRIPLFPLNLVLFPGQNLPLHIFEERYKDMLKRCLRENLPFGIVLVRETGGRATRGTPYSVGTTAYVTSVNEIPEGRCVIPAPHSGVCYHITCRGDERFRVTNLDRREHEYLVGDIEMWPDEESQAPAMVMVAQRVAGLFDDYYRALVALMGGWQREAPDGERTLMFDMAALVAGQARLSGAETASEGDGPRSIVVPSLPEAPESLANIVASELNTPPEVKQELLELPSALARLQREAEILSEETPQMTERLHQQNRRRYTAFGMSS
jgi:Lon protease-like protein